MMKYLLSFTVTLIALALAGCGQSTQEEQTSESTTSDEDKVVAASPVMDQALDVQEAGRCAFFFSYKEGDKQLNVYHSPSTSSQVVATLKNESVDDAYIYITPCDNKDWYHVSKSAKGPYIGYMQWDRAFLDGELAEGTCECTVTDPDGYVNVRQYATTKSKVIKTFPKGHHFIGLLADDNNQWMGVLEERAGDDQSEHPQLIGFVHVSKIAYSNNEE